MADNRERWCQIAVALARVLLPAAEQYKVSWETRLFGANQGSLYKQQHWNRLRDACQNVIQPENTLPADYPVRPRPLPAGHFDKPLQQRDIGYYVTLFHLWNQRAVVLPNEFRLDHSADIVDPKTLIDEHPQQGIELTRVTRNDLFHDDHREGLSLRQFGDFKRRLVAALVQLTGLTAAQAGLQIGPTCNEPISTTAVQQIFQNLQVQWVMQDSLTAGLFQIGQGQTDLGQLFRDGVADLAEAVRTTALLDPAAIQVYAFGLLYTLICSMDLKCFTYRCMNHLNPAVSALVVQTISDVFHIPYPSLSAQQFYSRLRNDSEARAFVAYYVEGFNMMGYNFGALMEEVLCGERRWSRLADVLYNSPRPIPSKAQVIHLAHEALAGKGILLPIGLMSATLQDFRM